MILDKEDHKIILLEMIRTGSLKGEWLDVVLELRRAIRTATITAQIENKKEEQNAP